MKKLFFTTSFIFLVLGINAQQWNGASNASGDIYRTGNVAIGASGTTGGKLVIRQKSSNDHYSGIQLKNSNTNQSSFFWMDLNDKMRIDNSNTSSRTIAFNGSGNGSVAIGMTGSSGRLAINQKSSNDHFSGIQLKNSNTNQSSFFWMDSSNTMHFDNASNASRAIVFNATGSGNVGIGVSNPTEKLTVDGMVFCTEVKVQSDVTPDYVFEKYYTGESALKAEYVMPTLEEVEAYTKANNHLPEMPSAQEIKENGLHLKEMTNLLLQKIEELTLYTIEQEKRIKALETKLAK